MRPYFFVFVIVFFFQMVSFVCLFCFAYPGTHSVRQAGLELSSTCLPNAGNKGMNQPMSDFDPIFKTKQNNKIYSNNIIRYCRSLFSTIYFSTQGLDVDHLLVASCLSF